MTVVTAQLVPPNGVYTIDGKMVQVKEREVGAGDDTMATRQCFPKESLQ
jgi:hypothetical protein